MDAWMKWMNANKASFVDGGAPLGKTKRVDAKGVSDIRNDVGGYSIVQAASADAAAKLFGKDQPHLQDARRMDRDRRDHADAGG